MRINPSCTIVSDKDDVDHLAKKAKIDGMRLVINLKKIEAINTQISVMERLENVYVARMGRDAYERKLVYLANNLPDARGGAASGCGAVNSPVGHI